MSLITFNFGQRKNTLFEKLNFNFEKNINMLLMSHDGKKITPVFEDIFNLPYEKGTFDYVVLNDVLHHVDEKIQSYHSHTRFLKEIKRVTKSGGSIIVIEGNRYSPVHYPSKVRLFGQEFFTQNYFKKVLNDVFEKVDYMFFEAHDYPWYFAWFAKIYEFFAQKMLPKKLLSYNVGVVNTVR